MARLEQNFSDLWRTRNNQFDLFVSAEDRPAAEETVKNLESGGVSAWRTEVADGGFSHVLSSGHLEGFLMGPEPNFVA